MNLTARKRTSLDNKNWWCVYDEDNHKYSTIVLFGKYKTKKECLWWIEKIKSELIKN